MLLLQRGIAARLCSQLSPCLLAVFKAAGMLPLCMHVCIARFQLNSQVCCQFEGCEICLAVSRKAHAPSQPVLDSASQHLPSALLCKEDCAKPSGPESCMRMQGSNVVEKAAKRAHKRAKKLATV